MGTELVSTVYPTPHTHFVIMQRPVGQHLPELSIVGFMILFAMSLNL